MVFQSIDLVDPANNVEAVLVGMDSLWHLGFTQLDLTGSKALSAWEPMPRGSASLPKRKLEAEPGNEQILNPKSVDLFIF